MELKNAQERFWSKVIKTETCWLWNGSIFDKNKQDNPYGAFWYKGQNRAAHRVAFEFQNGPIPDGLFVCHICDIGLCVRGDHLFTGTNKDNMKDMVNKGRSCAGDKNAARKYPEKYCGANHWTKRFPEKIKRGFKMTNTKNFKRGLDNSATKLTEEIVKKIRQDASYKTQKEQAREYGVSTTAIGYIIKRINWAHVE